MEIIKERLTSNAVAARMAAKLKDGYTAPELARSYLLYIKLNQLENKYEREQEEKNREQQVH